MTGGRQAEPSEPRAEHAPERPQAAPKRRDAGRLKKWLVGALFLGVLAYSGAGGTFSSFTAETNNPGSGIASGTLTLSEAVNQGSACYSYSGTNASGNTNSNCGALLTLANLEPGQWSISGQTSSIVVDNTGSLPASTFALYAPSGTSCSDSATTTPGASGATDGGNLNFITPSQDNLCEHTDLFIQETSGANYYCWYGAQAGPTGSHTSGLCAEPMSVSLGAAVSNCNTATSLTLSSIPGNIAAGDTLSVTGGGTTCTFTVGASSYTPTTAANDSVTVTGGTYVPSCSSSCSAISSGTVTDTTSQTDLNSYSADTQTVSNFDSEYNSSVGRILLYPINGPDSINTSATTDLAAVSSRSFTVGAYVPNPTGSNENNLQGLQLSFEIDWYISQ